MRITVIVLLLASSFAVSSQLVAADQTPADVAGNWDVTIRLPAGPVIEHWTIKQERTVVTAAAKTGHGELPVSGTIEGAFFRVTVKDGDKQYKVRATVDGAEMDGSITLGVGDSRLWFAKRSTNSKKAGDR